jgi:hypothetical protein
MHDVRGDVGAVTASVLEGFAARLSVHRSSGQPRPPRSVRRCGRDRLGPAGTRRPKPHAQGHRALVGLDRSSGVVHVALVDENHEHLASLTLEWKDVPQMPAIAVPLAADKLDVWEAWIGEMNGPSKAEFDDMNARHGLREHRAYLQAMPDVNFLVLAIHEGPGADGFIGNQMSSEHEFDQWFMKALAEIHGIDASGPAPPMAARKL